MNRVLGEARLNGVDEGAGVIGADEGARLNGVDEGAGVIGAVEGAGVIGVDEGAEMTDGADTNEGTSMDAAAAAAIIADAGNRARDRLRPHHRATFTLWGLLWLIGYGVTWLVVRGQQPVHGPAPAAFAAFTLIALVATLATVEEARSETGVGGMSAVRRRAFMVSALAGYAAMFALEGALARAGASRPVLVVYEAAAPVLIVGLLYLARSVTGGDWPVAGLGLWLVIVAAVSGYAGPQTVWAIDALAVGLAFLLVAALEPRLYRS